jgi:hypothetical protein
MVDQSKYITRDQSRSIEAVEKSVKIDSQDYVESLRNKKMGEASVQDQRCSPPPIGFLKIDLHDQEQKRLSGSSRKIKPRAEAWRPDRDAENSYSKLTARF